MFSLLTVVARRVAANIGHKVALNQSKIHLTMAIARITEQVCKMIVIRVAITWKWVLIRSGRSNKLFAARRWLLTAVKRRRWSRHTSPTTVRLFSWGTVKCPSQRRPRVKTVEVIRVPIKLLVMEGARRITRKRYKSPVDRAENLNSNLPHRVSKYGKIINKAVK